MRPGAFLPAFSLRRPVTTSMLLAATLVLGAISYSGIPVQLMPRGYDHPYLWVWMPYNNASPQEVERTIAVTGNAALVALLQNQAVFAQEVDADLFVAAIPDDVATSSLRFDRETTAQDLLAD